MQHKIKDFCDKISVMHYKAEKLRQLKYDYPKSQQDETLIKEMIADIQALAGDIANDKQVHPKLKK
jgi:hypothetical protein